jgi:hypothetical protein
LLERCHVKVIAMRRVSLAVLLIIFTAAKTASSAPQLQSIAVEGTVFKVTMDGGRVLYSPDLIGAKLVIKQADRLLRLRIEDIARDPDDKRSETAAADVIWLHHISIEGPDGAQTPLCDPGPDGRRDAIPIAGHLLASENRFVRGEPGQFEFACTSGALGKCIRFGYHPWQTHAHLSPAQSMLAVYNACIRMVRADYGGAGVGTTRNGMRIYLYDGLGIQAPDPHESGADMPFEAGWTEDGAVCVNHPRVAENVSLEDIEARWPRLAGKTGAICTEEFARSLGAVLFDRSAR